MMTAERSTRPWGPSAAAALGGVVVGAFVGALVTFLLPGLRELSAAAGRIEVEYEDLPTGGRIIFSSQDGDMITAVHRWFGAQLSDHGADATYR